MMLHVLNFGRYIRQPQMQAMLWLGTASVCYAVFNRIIMTKFFFDYPIVLLILQMAVILALIEVGRLFGRLKLAPYTFHRGKDIFPASLFFIMAHFLNLNCLDGTTMPLFPLLQRFAPLIIIELQRQASRGQRPPPFDMVCIGLLCSAAAVSSVYEWTFDLWSVIYGLLSVALESYAMFWFDRLREHYTSWLELLYMHAFNCLCLLLVADLIQDEIRDSFMYLTTSTTFLFFIILSVLVLIGICFHAGVFYCVQVNGAVHASVIHILAGAIQLFVAYGLSMYLFYDLKPTWTNVIGVCVTSCVGIFYYIACRSLDKHNNGLMMPARAHLVEKH